MRQLEWGWELLKFKAAQTFGTVSAGKEPWLDPETKQWHRAALANSQSYLEFGSGGSTYLAATLGIPTIAVEGDHAFADAVRRQLPAGNKVTLISAPIGLTGPWGVPVPGSPTKSRVTRWRSYIDLPFAELGKSGRPFPDLVLVDGRFRRACALRTAYEAGKVGAKPTILFDDYYADERAHYNRIEAILGAPERIGRSAIFRIDDATNVSQSAIDEAITDFH